MCRSDERTCIACGEPKPLAEFHRTHTTHLRTCRDCYCAIIRIRRRNRTEPIPREEQHGAWCPKCYGMSWRRPKHGACTCGEAWAAEPLERLDPFSRRGEPRCELGARR